MKRILPFLLLLLSATIGYSQIPLDMATGEYAIFAVKPDGTVWVPYMTVYDAAYATTQVSGLANITQADGGQYTGIFMDNAGKVYSAVGGTTTSTAYPTDNLGNTFSGCSKIYAMWRMGLAIKGGQLYYWSAAQTSPEDMLLQFGTLSTSVPAPRLLIQPPGSRTIVKCAFGSNPSPYNLGHLWALCSDGTLWQWDQTHTTPFQLTGKPGFSKTFSGTVTDIAVGGDVNLVYTSTNQVWVWGYDASDYGGHSDWANADMDSINQNMTGAGVVFPLKQMFANYLNAGVIDANNYYWSIGGNQTGALGSGYMAPSWRTNWNGASNAVYSYDYVHSHGNQGTWLQIPGVWSKIKTNSSFVFYLYGQDMAGNWYGWGRNKDQCLWQGETYKAADQSNYPEWLDKPAPRQINPWTVTWSVDGTVSTAAARNPIANAGINQYIPNGTTTTTLYGQGSHQQQPTNSLTVTMAYLWTKISGPSGGTISTPTTANTTVTSLASGTYVYQLKVTNSVGAVDSSQVTLQVSPTANAGQPQTITLPTSSVNLDGTGSSGATSYAWTQDSGPATVSFGSPSGATTTATGLTIAGTYVLRLTINSGVSYATVTITVNPNPSATCFCVIINK